VRKLISALGLLLVIALFFLGMVLGGGDREESRREPPQSLAPAGAARGNDLQVLESAFGCPVPYASRSGSGAVSDETTGSLRARMFSWEGSDGLIITAVRPAEAAHLLRREGLKTNASQLWSLDGKSVLTASGAAGACAYYETEDAAYCLYLPGGDADSLLSRLATDVTFPSPDQQ